MRDIWHGGIPQELGSECDLSQGSRRFGRLIAAARKGEVVPPVDTRYLRKGLPTRGDADGDAVRGRVASFLTGIYESVAETLPDVRDDEAYDGPMSEHVAAIPQADPDPYTESLHDPQVRLKLKPQTRGVRARRLGVDLNTARRPENGFEKRFLPPGHIREYYDQFLATDAGSVSSNGKKIAFSTFWRIWYADFGAILQFRPTSSHAMCATCARHKILIRSMAGHLRARQKQVEHFANHLKSQYQDRLVYWDLRAQSRLRNNLEVTIICDGMDQNKFLFPRSGLFRSKDLQSMTRPKAHVAAAIIHGHAVIFCVSPPEVRKDANSCVELLAYCLQRLSQKLDLSKVTVNIQSDNASREIKNNHVIRWLASLVCHRSMASTAIRSDLFERSI